jgi:N4-gp56 family major capsid protein
MAVTKMANMINPEVMGPMIEAKIDALLKLTPYARVDRTLVGVPGDTKTVPSWNYIGDAEDVAEGAEVGLSTLTASTTTFTIKKAMKAVGITQEAVNSGLGNPIGQAEKQLAKAIAGKVDNDVLDAVYKGTNVYAGSALAAIAYGGIVDAIAKFEDEEDGIEKVMFINPAQEAALLKDSDFLSADKFTAGVALNGSIGRIAGAWVKKSKKVRLVTYEVDNTNGTVTIDADNLAEYQAKVDPSSTLAVGNKVKAIAAASQYYLCPIIKLEPDSAETEYTEDELPAVTIFLKKDIQVDSEWFPKKQQTDVTAAKYYGVAKTNDAKIVLAKFKK